MGRAVTEAAVDPCQRHKPRVVFSRAFRTRKGPGGTLAGPWGVAEQTKCEKCGHTEARWAAGIKADTAEGALRAYGLTDAEIAVRLGRVDPTPATPPATDDRPSRPLLSWPFPVSTRYLSKGRK